MTRTALLLLTGVLAAGVASVAEKPEVRWVTAVGGFRL